MLPVDVGARRRVLEVAAMTLLLILGGFLALLLLGYLAFALLFPEKLE